MLFAVLAALSVTLFPEVRRGVPNQEIRLGDGVYRIDSTVRINAGESGLRVIGTGKTVVTAAQPLPKPAAPFVRGEDGVWQAKVEFPEEDRMVFSPDGLIVDGRPMRMARFPNVEPGKPVYGTWTLGDADRYCPEKDALLPARVARWRNPAGAYLHVMHQGLWGDVQYRVTGRDGSGALIREGGWQMNRETHDHPVFRYVENVREELDRPGEWHYDARSRTLSLIPFEGVDPNAAEIEYTVLPCLFRVERATGVEFRGVRFTGAARTFMANSERVLLSDWTLCRLGALSFVDAGKSVVADCDFADLGGNAVVFDGRCRDCVVTGSLFHDIGASGVVIVGRPSAVRSPRFHYEEDARKGYDLDAIDRTPGPAGDDYPVGCAVRDSLFFRTGTEEKQTAPVTIMIAANCEVADCTVFDVPRAGINVGTGAFGGHLITGCDVFDTVKETGDHGSFNSWGRDRFWQADLGRMENAVAANPGLERLDILATTRIVGNRFRCDHGWDVDLDDGSSDYLIEDNLLLNGGLKLREGYRRTVRNNYLHDNTLHAHCWLANSRDVVTNNVFFFPIATAGRMIHWGDAVTPNVLAAPGAVPPRPARRYGVTSPRLRALAREPEVPPLKFPEGARAADGAVVRWRGMELRAFDGAREYSAFGVPRETTGHVVVGGAREPFRTGDLILSPLDERRASWSVVRNQLRVTLERSDSK